MKHETMNWLTFDIVKQGVRTHVYSVPQRLFTSLGHAAILAAKDMFLGVLKERHPDSTVHEGEPFGLDAGFNRQLKQRMLAQFGLSESDLASSKHVYDAGTPEHREVLCFPVDSGMTDPIGRQVRMLRPIFPDHPQYDEVREALRRPSTQGVSSPVT
jgi:hypothetical protein